MHLQKSIKIKIYDTTVCFIVCEDAQKKVNQLYKKYNTGMKFNEYLEGLMFTVSMNRYYLVVGEAHLTHNTILHELFHTVKAIAFDRNISEEESLAWIQGFIGEQIYKFLESKNIKIS